MMRHLVRNFERVLKFNLHATTHTASCLTTTAARRTLFTQHEYEDGTGLQKPTLKATSATISSHATPFGNEVDSDYIPYRAEMESGGPINTLINALRERFRLTEQEVQRIVSDEQVQRFYRNRCFLQALDLLMLEGVTKQSFVEYPWLLALDKSKLEYLICFLQYFIIQKFQF